MSTLFLTGDTLKQNRLNRSIVLGRVLGLPMYDDDNASSITVAAIPVDGVAIASSSTTYYTAPSTAGSIAEILTITLCNTDSVARAVDINIVENGGSVGVSTAIWRDTLQPGEEVIVSGPWFLGPSDTLRATAAAASVVSLRAEVLEFGAQPGGLNFKVINGASLGTSVSTYYTMSGFTQAILLAASLCNTDTVSRTPELHVIHNGDTAAVKNRIWSEAIVTKGSAIIQPFAILKTSDFIQAKASSASVVGLRLTVLEVT